MVIKLLLPCETFTIGKTFILVFPLGIFFIFTARPSIALFLKSETADIYSGTLSQQL